MCTGKRQTHIRNAPSSRTAVSGIGPYRVLCKFVAARRADRAPPLPRLYVNIVVLRNMPRSNPLSQLR